MNVQIALRMLGIPEEQWNAAVKAFDEAPAAIAEMREMQKQILVEVKALRDEVYLLRDEVYLLRDKVYLLRNLPVQARDTAETTGMQT